MLTVFTFCPGVGNAAVQQNLWRTCGALSRRAGHLVDCIERFLDHAGFNRAPWAVVGFAGGIAAWFALANRWQWLALITLSLGMALAAAMINPQRLPFLRLAVMSMGVMVALGCATIWIKSQVAGTLPIRQMMVANVVAKVVQREEEPAFGEVRLLLVLREPVQKWDAVQTGMARAIRVRVTVPDSTDQPGLAEGAIIRLRIRLMPPSPPWLPGVRDMTLEDWFGGIAASGRMIGPARVLRPPAGDAWLARLRHTLMLHVHGAIPGSAGGIAVTLVSGNRGDIAWQDQQAMRDAGLTHLLAISGLHVSAVVAGAWFITFRLLALLPWVALRLRLPLVASGAGALAGVFYTVLTGAHLPTVRACVGALLLLGGMAAGRQPLSMRLLAVAAMVVMAVWPEAVIGPSFQMSFGSVMAIVALHEAAPMHAFLAVRQDAWWRRAGRHLVALLLSGMVIDLALMPVALFHFHRAGAYGALANLVAIPLVTFVAMPLLALGLALDGAGAMVGVKLGTWAWWAAGYALNFLLEVTHWLVARPGAVSLLPPMGGGRYTLFICGMVWLALWRGRVRLWGLVPALIAAVSLVALRSPDLLITGDGRNIGIVMPAGEGANLLVLHEGKNDYTRNMLLEAAGISGRLQPLAQWPGASCNHDFCLITLSRGGRLWRILMARNNRMPPYMAMAHACAGADIVVTQVMLYGPCRPSLIRADRTLLMRTGGLALDLVHRRVTSVEDSEGEHPWWRAPHRLPNFTADDGAEP